MSEQNYNIKRRLDYLTEQFRLITIRLNEIDAKISKIRVSARKYIHNEPSYTIPPFSIPSTTDLFESNDD